MRREGMGSGDHHSRNLGAGWRARLEEIPHDRPSRRGKLIERSEADISEAACKLLDEINLLLDAGSTDLRPPDEREQALISLVVEEIMTAEGMVRTLRKTRHA
jgi:hypothetical protein